jgi:hypothetical protein
MNKEQGEKISNKEQGIKNKEVNRSSLDILQQYTVLKSRNNKQGRKYRTRNKEVTWQYYSF